MALPAFWNVGALLLLAFFMYAYIGVLLFGTVKRQIAINEHANFEHFGTAALTLFRVATLDEWPYLMDDLGVQPPDCDKEKGECGNIGLSIVYFMTFIVIVAIIMLNLFTAVIVETFEKQDTRSDWKLSPTALEVNRIFAHWYLLTYSFENELSSPAN